MLDAPHALASARVMQPAQQMLEAQGGAEGLAARTVKDQGLVDGRSFWGSSLGLPALGRQGPQRADSHPQQALQACRHVTRGGGPETPHCLTRLPGELPSMRLNGRQPRVGCHTHVQLPPQLLGQLSKWSPKTEICVAATCACRVVAVLQADMRPRAPPPGAASGCALLLLLPLLCARTAAFSRSGESVAKLTGLN